MIKPLAIDLFCGMAYGVAHGNKFRQSKMGERISFEEKAWAASAWTRRKPEKAWRHSLSRASILAFHDDSLCVEQPGARGLPFVSRQGDQSLRSVAGVFKFSFGHGNKTNTGAHAGQN
jgi:hypothetical protein